MSEKNKIAILTLYHNNYNYGGLLQSFALWKVLEGQGYDVRQVSYVLDSGYPRYSINLIQPVKEFAKSVLYGSYYTGVKKRRKAMNIFEAKIPHTDEVTAQNIQKLNGSFDTFVCGSDQIWNPIGWQNTLFLSFADPGKRKIAYAASMARESLTQEEATYAYKMTRDFYAISLREEKSLAAMQQYYPDFRADIMPDPTLLLEQNEWKALAALGETGDKGDYIFAYFLSTDNYNREMAIQYARERHQKIYFINYLDVANRQWEKSHKNVMCPKGIVEVPDFLALIQNASLVITDSFHGAVFSSIFHTPYVAMNRFKNSDKNSMNSRIDTLMATLNINRKIESLNATHDYSLSDEETRNIDAALRMQRKKGIDFLNRAITGDL
jgi:hypothetical protein